MAEPLWVSLWEDSNQVKMEDRRQRIILETVCHEVYLDDKAKLAREPPRGDVS